MRGAYVTMPFWVKVRQGERYSQRHVFTGSYRVPYPKDIVQMQM